MNEKVIIALAVVSSVLFVWILVLSYILKLQSERINRLRRSLAEDYEPRYTAKILERDVRQIENSQATLNYILSVLISHLGLVYEKKEIGRFVKAISAEKKKG